MIVHTIVSRPYVFALFLVYLISAFKTKGIPFIIHFTVIGYFIAWASEYLSINTGYPYGWYFYRYENLQGEWLNAGVPVWDSLSYVFLCYAGLSMAEYLRGREQGELIKTAFYSALFVTLLDIVIDPLAHLGDQWFLGNIYYYPKPGFYFNVPLSNFVGWFVVSFLIVLINLLVGKIHPIMRLPIPQSAHFIVTLSGPLLYLVLFLFNWFITLWIHAWWLALADILWMAAPCFLFISRWRRRSVFP